MEMPDRMCGAFAILLPGVKYAKDAQAYKAAQQPQNDAQEVTFTKDEQQQIDDVKSLQILLTRIVHICRIRF